MRPLFITGIGTDVGKTVVSAILVEALQADYWKPVQAGFDRGTDSEWVKNVAGNDETIVHPEIYKLRLAASPHIAAREEGINIDLDLIARRCKAICEEGKSRQKQWLITEGAGGLLVPLNQSQFVLDLILALNAKTLLVSRNYLGSINHSLLTARACKTAGLDVLGWVFNDQYLDYEKEIAGWTALPKIASIPFRENPGGEFIKQQAEAIRPVLHRMLDRQD